MFDARLLRNRCQTVPALSRAKSRMLVSRELCALCKEPTHICDAKYHDKIKKAAVNLSACCSACYSGRPVGFLVVGRDDQAVPKHTSIWPTSQQREVLPANIAVADGIRADMNRTLIRINMAMSALCAQTPRQNRGRKARIKGDQNSIPSEPPELSPHTRLPLCGSNILLSNTEG